MLLVGDFNEKLGFGLLSSISGIPRCEANYSICSQTIKPMLVGNHE